MNWDSLHTSSRTALLFFFDAMVRAMIVMLVVAGIALLMRRSSAAARHRVWLTGFIATALLPLLLLLPGWRILPAVVESRSEVVLTRDATPDAEPPPTDSISEVPLQPSQSVRTSVTPASEEPAARPVMPIVLGGWMALWILGAAGMGGRLVLSRLKLARVARAARPAPATLQSAMDAVRAKLLIRRNVRLLQDSEPLSMPMTWGFVRPTILLPADAEDWPEGRLRIVLLHELSHAKRLDYVWLLVAELAAGFYWFNPLWRWALNHLRDESERACDESVIAAGEDRCSYARELLATVADWSKKSKAIVLALGMSRCSTLESRFKSILNPPVRIGGTRIGAIAVAGLLLLCAPLSQIRLEAQSKPAASPTSEPALIVPTTAPSTSDVTYGGIAQDSDGKPIAGAKIITGWEVPHQLGVRQVIGTSGADGRWTVQADSSWTLSDIRTAEPGYVRQWIRNIDTSLLRARTFQMTMARSITVTGYVHDEGGEPIVGALITPPLIWSSVRRGGVHDPALVYTGADGKFSIDGLSPANVKLYVSAQAFAPEVFTPKHLDRPVLIVLGTGGNVQGTVVGRNKKPIAGAKVTMSEWRFDGLHHFSREAVTDDSGHFLIRHVPREGDVQIQASAPGSLGVISRVTARDEPAYELQMVRYPKAHGTVLDDATGKPITSFRWSLSAPVEGSDEIRFADFIHTNVENPDGKFDVEARMARVYSRQQLFRVRVSADDYMTQDSPVFSPEQEAFFDIRLKRTTTLSGTVVSADGTSVNNAQVAWVRPDRHAFVSVNGTIETQYADSPDSIANVDTSGRFHDLKVTSTSGNVLVISPDGFALQSSEQFGASGKLVLKPWASLHGKYMQDKPLVNQVIHLRAVKANEVIWADMLAQVGVDGAYNFPRAPVTEVTITSNYDGHKSTNLLELKPGHASTYDVFRNN